MIKKLVLASVLIMGGLLAANPFTATAQNVGEAYVKDGVPCVIIDVDDAGEKGLVMTLVPTKKAFKAAKKTGESKWFYIPKKMKKAERKLCSEYIEELYNRTKCDTFEIRVSKLSSPDRLTTSLSGKENMKSVIEFCNEKGISLEAYFPRFAWAQSLGEGWYIPGIEELKLYVRLFGYESIGTKYKQNPFKLLEKFKEVHNVFKTSIENMEDKALFNDVYYPNYMLPIFSSTMSALLVGEGYLELVMWNDISGNYFNMGSFGDIKAEVCAVCEVDFK